METRTEIIQRLIDKYKLTSYVEIGVQNKDNNFNKIKCELKIGVDPDPNAKATYPITSNDFFFIAITHGVKYGLIFVDGLHHEDQGDKDLENALECLEDGGWIVVHDCNPENELHQRVPRESKIWNGDVWKSFVKLREREDLDMVTIDCDYGCGIIRKGTQTPLRRTEELTYENLEKNRSGWLYLVSPDFFERIYL